MGNDRGFRFRQRKELVQSPETPNLDATPSITDGGIGDEGLVCLLRALAADAAFTDGWQDAAPTCNNAADRIEALLRTLAESKRLGLEAAEQLAESVDLLRESAATLADRDKRIGELVEALSEARLIVANVPGDESLFLAKIDAALSNNLDRVVR